MTDKVVNTSDQVTIKSIFKVLKRNLLFIILITILTTIIGFGYGVLTVEPQYTKRTSVMLTTDFNDAVGNEVSNAQEINLANKLLNSAQTILLSADFINEVNKNYKGEGDVNIGAISMIIGTEKSLVFDITYTDKSYDLAEEKLDAIIETARIYLPNRLLDGVQEDLVELTNVHSQSMHYDRSRHIIIGAVVGIVVSLGYLIIKHLLDNTVKSSAEAEAITGVYTLAYIDLQSQDRVKRAHQHYSSSRK